MQRWNIFCVIFQLTRLFTYHYKQLKAIFLLICTADVICCNQSKRPKHFTKTYKFHSKNYAHVLWLHYFSVHSMNFICFVLSRNFLNNFLKVFRAAFVEQFHWKFQPNNSQTALIMIKRNFMNDLSAQVVNKVILY